MQVVSVNHSIHFFSQGASRYARNFVLTRVKLSATPNLHSLVSGYTHIAPLHLPAALPAPHYCQFLPMLAHLYSSVLPRWPGQTSQYLVTVPGNPSALLTWKSYLFLVNDLCSRMVARPSRTVRIAITKQCSQMTLCFTTLYSNGNSVPNWCHNLRATCNHALRKNKINSFQLVSSVPLSHILLILWCLY